MRHTYRALLMALGLVVAGAVMPIASQAAAPRTFTVGPTQWKHSGGDYRVVHDAPYSKSVRMLLTPKAKYATTITSLKFGDFALANRGRHVSVCLLTRSNGVVGGIYVSSPSLKGFQHQFTTRRTSYSSLCYKSQISRNPKGYSYYQAIEVSSNGNYGRADFVERLTVTVT